MKIGVSFHHGMWNWGITPIVTVWGGWPFPGRSSGISIHFLRLYFAVYAVDPEAD